LRVSEADVARVLQLIASEPNRRAKRRRSDLEGAFDYWFDGGAVSMLTQHIHYFFADGTNAYRGISAHGVHVTIVFAGGERVTVAQS
jgi:hypothetical protein